MQLELSQLITIGLICIAFGVGSSILLKRIDLLQKFGRGVRISANGLVNLIAPFLVIFLTPLWNENMGDIDEVSKFMAALLVSLVTFTASQYAHEKDAYQSPGVATAAKKARTSTKKATPAAKEK